MKVSSFTDGRVVDALKRAEACISVPDLCRELTGGKSAFCKWRARLYAMNASMTASAATEPSHTMSGSVSARSATCSTGAGLKSPLARASRDLAGRSARRDCLLRGTAAVIGIALPVVLAQVLSGCVKAPAPGPINSSTGHLQQTREVENLLLKVDPEVSLRLARRQPSHFWERVVQPRDATGAEVESLLYSLATAVHESTHLRQHDAARADPRLPEAVFVPSSAKGVPPPDRYHLLGKDYPPLALQEAQAGPELSEMASLIPPSLRGLPYVNKRNFRLPQFFDELTAYVNGAYAGVRAMQHFRPPYFRVRGGRNISGRMVEMVSIFALYLHQTRIRYPSIALFWERDPQVSLFLRQIWADYELVLKDAIDQPGTGLFFNLEFVQSVFGDSAILETLERYRIQPERNLMQAWGSEMRRPEALFPDRCNPDESHARPLPGKQLQSLLEMRNRQFVANKVFQGAVVERVTGWQKFVADWSGLPTRAELDDEKVRVARLQIDRLRPAMFPAPVGLPKSVHHAAVGSTHQDCEECPTMVRIPAPKDGVSHWISKTEVTVRQWARVMGRLEGNSCRPTGPRPANLYVHAPRDEDCPVGNVSLEEAREYASRLSILTGRSYRLPTEAEWLHACHAGKPTKFCGSDHADEVGWFRQDSRSERRLGGLLKPNAFGLHDMSGNVSEWVEIDGAVPVYGQFLSPPGVPFCDSGGAGLRSNCIGTLTFASGSSYQGMFLDNQYHGRGEYTFRSMNRYVGDWDRGKATGNGTFNSPGYYRYVGEFVDMKYHGLGILYDSQGGIDREGEWRDGKFVRSVSLDRQAYAIDRDLGMDEGRVGKCGTASRGGSADLPSWASRRNPGSSAGIRMVLTTER